jgi:hypothetical protein
MNGPLVLNRFKGAAIVANHVRPPWQASSHYASYRHFEYDFFAFYGFYIEVMTFFRRIAPNSTKIDLYCF